MATEYTCITRKIEVHLHRHGDSEEALQRYKEEFRIWDEINDNLYKAANRIISHCFFNDAYEYRLKLHSPRFKEIEKLLKYAKRNKLTDDDIKALKAERKELFAKGDTIILHSAFCILHCRHRRRSDKFQFVTDCSLAK